MKNGHKKLREGEAGSCEEIERGLGDTAVTLSAVDVGQSELRSSHLLLKISMLAKLACWTI